MAKTKAGERKLLSPDITKALAKPLAKMGRELVADYTDHVRQSAWWFENVVCPAYNLDNDIEPVAVYNSALDASGNTKPEVAKVRGASQRTTIAALCVLARTTGDKQEQITGLLLGGMGINATTKKAREEKWIELAKPRKTEAKAGPVSGAAPKPVSLEEAGAVGSLQRIANYVTNFPTTFFTDGARTYREHLDTSPTPYQAMRTLENAVTVALKTLHKLEEDAKRILQAERSALRDEKAA